jgi:signal transduction histidine kinase
MSNRVFTTIILIIAFIFLSCCFKQFWVSGVLIIVLLVILLVARTGFFKELYSVANTIDEMRKGQRIEKFLLSSSDPLIPLKTKLNNLYEEVFSALNSQRDLISNLESVLNLLNTPAFVMDRHGKILTTNAECKVLKKANVNCKRCFYYEFFYNTTLIDLLGKCLNQDVRDIEVSVGGRFYKLNSFGKDMAGQGRVVVCVLNDITDQKEREIMEREFISAVSHELKTPLSVISNIIEIIQDAHLDKEERNEFFESMKKNTNRMNELVQKLLILTEIRNKKQISRIRINLLECVEDVLSNEKGEIEESGISLKKHLKDVWVLGDCFLIKEMVKNIIENALKYSQGDTLTISVSKNNFAIIKIQDNGIGMSENDIAHIFEPFYRLEQSRSRKGGGTGLGLTISKRIAELHRGHITVNSRKGVGTEFIIQLPLVEN